MKPIIRNPIIPIFASCLALTGHAMAQVLITPGAPNYGQNFDGFNVVADVSTAGTGAPILWNGTASVTKWQNNITYPGWIRQVAIGLDTNRTDKDYIGEFTSGTIRFGNMGNGVAGDGSLDAGPTTDRALGVLMRGTGNSASFGVVFQIGEGVAVSDVNISYFGEQWFRAPDQTPNDRLDFQCKVLASYDPATFLINDETGWTDIDELDFAAVKEGANQKSDGNYVGSEFGPNRIALSAKISPVIAPGQYLAMRWRYVSDSANDQSALAVDDLLVSFGTERGAIPINNTSFTHTENFNALPPFDAPNPVTNASEAHTILNWGTDPANVDGWDGTGWYRKRKFDSGKDITGVANFLSDNWGFANIGSDNSTDRAIGSMGSSDFAEIDPKGLSVAFGMVFQADPGVNGINQATVSYKGEQWFNAAGDQSRLDFQYKIRSAAQGPISPNTTILSDTGWTNVNELDFVAPDTGGANANDGNAVFTNLAQTFTLNQTLDEGEYLVIRWLHATKGDPSQYRSAETPSYTDGLFVDDLSVTLTAFNPDFKITAVSLAGNTLSMTADGLTGGSQYHVEYSPDLTTVFADVAASTFTAGGTTESINVTVSGTKGFYRLASGAGSP